MQKISSNPKTKILKKSTGKGAIQSEELDPRWATFLDLFIKSSNSYQSALQAGFSESYAVVIRQRFPEKVKKSLAEALEAKGIDSEKNAEKIRVSLDSDEPNAIDKGIAHAAKIGVGGGYAPEKKVTLSLEVSKEERDKLLGITSQVMEKMTHEEING